MSVKINPGFCILAHPFEEGYSDAPSLLKRVDNSFRDKDQSLCIFRKPIHNIQLGKEAADFFYENRINAIIIMLATWSDDSLAVNLAQRLNLPIITWAIEGISRGSLCGCQQINCVMKELDMKYDLVFGSPEDGKTINQITELVKINCILENLKALRICRIGSRTPGMTEIAFDEFEIKKIFGADVFYTDFHQIESIAMDVSDSDAQDEWQSIKNRSGCVKTDDKTGIESVKLKAAIKLFLQQENAEVAAVQCYPEHMGKYCLAGSILIDEGIVIACEADVHAGLIAWIMRHITGKAVHNTDLLHVYHDEQCVLLSHCGNGSFSIASSSDEITLNHVRLAESGLCVLFPSKQGQVTLINLVGRKGTMRLGIIEGTAVKTDMVFAGNPLKVHIPASTNRFLDWVADNGIGHHWIAGYHKGKHLWKNIAEKLGIAWNILK